MTDTRSNRVKIGAQIHRIRTTHALTQTQLAKELGISGGTVSVAERGLPGLSFNSLVAIRDLALELHPTPGIEGGPATDTSPDDRPPRPRPPARRPFAPVTPPAEASEGSSKDVVVRSFALLKTDALDKLVDYLKKDGRTMYRFLQAPDGLMILTDEGSG